MLLENGTYRAKVQDVHLYERGVNKRLTAAFRLEAEGKEIIHREWLELNDGTISEKALARMRKCFPAWDGSIEALDEGSCCRDISVEIVVENEPDQQDPNKTWSRVRWMNPPGGGASADLPERIDRGSLVARYAGKFRALAGGRAAAPAAPAASAAAAAPAAGKQVAAGLGLKPASSLPPPAKKPAAEAAVSSLEECWELLCKRDENKPRAQVEACWFRLLEKVARGKEAADFEPAEWGKVKSELTDNLPF